MFSKLKNKKGFTLIELIVVMAIIGILVLLAIPKFMGHTQQAKYTKLISNTKQLENASERYYMDKQDWPRLSDTPYTAEEITAFSQKIYDATGKEAILAETGNYYDIDYSKLSKYVQIPDDKMNYVIQNPVGNIYALENVTQESKVRLETGSILLDKTTLSLKIGESDTLLATIMPTTAINKNVSWMSSNTSVATINSTGKITAVGIGNTTITVTTETGNHISTCNITVTAIFTAITFTNAGATGVNGPTQSQLNSAYIGTSLAGLVTSTNGIQLWTVPTSGIYSIISSGASGGGPTGGKGAIIGGNVTLIQGEQLKILVGQVGAYVNDSFKRGGGGGGTFVARSNNTPLIVAGSGGGQGSAQSGYPAIIETSDTNTGLTGYGSIKAIGTYCGAGGSGFLSNSGTAFYGVSYAFINGGVGVSAFGGGASPYGTSGTFGNGVYTGAGGGGGGYSGGNGSPGYSSGGYGGGSYNSGTNQSNSVGNTGNGNVIISKIS